MKQWKEETGLVVRFLGLILGAAFVFAFVGTLLWINGRGAWFVMRYSVLPSFACSLTWLYCLWLVVYGLLGGAVPFSVFLLRARRRSWIPPVALLLCAYVLSLLWVPLFYTAQFVAAALFALLFAALALVLFLLCACRTSFWLTAAGTVAFVVQIYVFCFTLGFLLLN